MKKILFTVVLLALTAVMVTGVLAADDLSPKFDASGYVFSQDQLDALKLLNEHRTKAGAPAVELDARLCLAAENHAKYMSRNFASAELGAHGEEVGKPGFTGATPSARAMAIIDIPDTGYYASECIAWGSSCVDGIYSWLNSAYHRTGIIQADATTVGIAYYKGGIVIDIHSENSYSILPLVVYPYPGMKDVDISFNGNENPNPLEGLGIDKSGFIISIDRAGLVEIPTITNSSGDKIDYFDLNDYQYLIPRSPLAYDETYTVKIKYMSDNGVKDKTWSFTTKKASSSDINSTDVKIRLNGKYHSYVSFGEAFIRDSRTYVPLRGVLERYNTQIIWDDELRTATFIHNGNTVVLAPGSKTMKINGKSAALDAAPVIVNSRMYIPIRAVIEAFGGTVGWNEKTKLVDINMSYAEPFIKHSTHNMEAVIVSEDYWSQIQRIVKKYNFTSDYDTFIDSGNIRKLAVKDSTGAEIGTIELDIWVNYLSDFDIKFKSDYPPNTAFYSFLEELLGVLSDYSVAGFADGLRAWLDELCTYDGLRKPNGGAYMKKFNEDVEYRLYPRHNLPPSNEVRTRADREAAEAALKVSFDIYIWQRVVVNNK